MKEKRYSAVRKRGVSLAAVLALAACMLLGMTGEPVGIAKAVELDKNCSLTVTPGTHEDLQNAEVVIDLYKVADAEAVPGMDTYTFSPTGAYAELEGVKALEHMDTVDNSTYQAIAQEAAVLTLTSGNSIAKTADGQLADGKDVVSSLDSGLYLLIARGANLTEPDDYVTSIQDGNDTKLATVAYTETYTYNFQPELIALPSKAVNADGEVMTSNPGEWLYDLPVTLKSEQALRFGTLNIVKNLTSFATEEPASFVFRVEAYRDNTKEKLLYSNVFTINFNASGKQTVPIEGLLPVGAYVEVTEEYPGPSYKLTGGNQTQSAVIPAPDAGTASVQFTNSYEGTTTKGGTITNHFEYGTDDAWEWTQQ